MHPVLSCSEATVLERGLLGGEADREWEAMSRAGGALAEALDRDFREIRAWPDCPRILVAAGKGNNAGDALIAARHLLEAHPAASVDVIFALGEKALSPLALMAWKGLSIVAGDSGAVRLVSLDQEEDVVGHLRKACGRSYDLCLDGLFGMNFRPPFRSPTDVLVEWMNQELQADLRAAVDLPSGLSDEPAQLVVRADFTYMTGSAKKPLLAPQHAEWAGRLRYLDLGFFGGGPKVATTRSIILPEILAPIRGLRPAMGHKRSHGHLLIVGGSRLMPGAILMSIMAAARSGVGLLTAAVPESLVTSFAAMIPEAMWIGCRETAEGSLSLDGLYQIERIASKATAILLGPGVGTEEETQALFEAFVVNYRGALVIDAEALQAKVIKTLAARGGVKGRVAITPHGGEFARISGRQFSDSGEEGLLRFCRETGLITLLKGPPFSRVCDGQSISYGLPGGPVLARGGSGDILSGIAGSLVAQAPDALLLAMQRALLWHGLAAEALARAHGQQAVRTTQILDFLSPVLRGIERR